MNHKRQNKSQSNHTNDKADDRRRIDQSRRRAKAIRLNTQIDTLRQQRKEYITLYGINGPKTLECTIQLAEALGKHSPNWLEELNTLTVSERDQRESENASEQIALLRDAVNNSPDGAFNLQARLALASRLSDSDRVLYIDLIEKFSKHFGRDSNETVSCVEAFITSGFCTEQDHDLVYEFFIICKRKNGHATNISTDLVEFYGELGWTEFELEMLLDELSYRRSYEPLWFLDAVGFLIEDVCRLHAVNGQYNEFLILLDDLIESYSQMPLDSRQSWGSEEFKKFILLLECARREAEGVIRSLDQCGPEHVQSKLTHLLKDVFEQRAECI